MTGSDAISSGANLSAEPALRAVQSGGPQHHASTTAFRA